MAALVRAAAYGGEGWSPRQKALSDEIGSLWATCGLCDEWSRLKSVLLYRPGPELAGVGDLDQAQMLQTIDADLARRQHEALAATYRDLGVAVYDVEPEQSPPPNLMFVADLLLMTPEGAIVGRPASTVRAGEERFIARRLAALGMPILRTIRGTGTFEGADAAWLGRDRVLLATGLRTNKEGADQVADLLYEMGVDVVRVGLPYGAMHLMGQLRFADRDLAIAWPGRVPYAAVEALRIRDFEVLFLPDEQEAKNGMALNFATLGPREIVMAAGNLITQHFFERAGIHCHTVEIGELVKAAGGIGCLTGVLERA